jgi:dTDP-4-amino-4,6-dideoxygalactose transaminase
MMSDCGTFSFQKTKNINTFEGGMICIPKDSKLNSEKIRAICNQGQTSKYHHEYLGFNFRLAEPLCLLAYSQMKLHMKAIKSELGHRTIKDGHYPYVVYDQPAIKNKGITSNCPVAEKVAKEVKDKYFKPKDI